MDVEIIELGRDRLPEVVELCRLSFDLPEDAAEASAVVVTVAERAAADRPVLRLGAVRDGALVGVLVGSLSAADPRLGHVDLVAVAPTERRQGVGGALLTEA
ncbi:GNAT family N-acetyltransferase, partial [Micromonospora aurantiaca (nom. illeg.)]